MTQALYAHMNNKKNLVILQGIRISKHYTLYTVNKYIVKLNFKRDKYPSTQKDEVGES
jgi:hypothetical protein